MALIKYFVDYQKNKCERIVALIFGSGSERIMAFDCTTVIWIQNGLMVHRWDPPRKSKMSIKINLPGLDRNQLFLYDLDF